MTIDAGNDETLRPTDKIKTSRRSPSLSLDGQFWLRMACILPFSLAAWTVLIWWAFQELPIYASQFVDRVSHWTAEVVTGPVVAVVKGGEGPPNKTESRAADYPVTKSLENYPQPWRWHGPSGAAWPMGFASVALVNRSLSDVDEWSGPDQPDDPFSVTKFLDLLRRSNHSSVAFVPPPTLFPLSQHPANGSPEGPSLLSTTHYKLTAFTLPRTKNDRNSALVSLVYVGLVEGLEHNQCHGLFSAL
jgi:hypothetical protein